MNLNIGVLLYEEDDDMESSSDDDEACSDDDEACSDEGTAVAMRPFVME